MRSVFFLLLSFVNKDELCDFKTEKSSGEPATETRTSKVGSVEEKEVWCGRSSLEAQLQGVGGEE